jgi:hypothetical protein
MAGEEQYHLVHHPGTYCFEACKLICCGRAFQYQRPTLPAGIPEMNDRIMGARPLDAQPVALFKLINFTITPWPINLKQDHQHSFMGSKINHTLRNQGQNILCLRQIGRSITIYPYAHIVLSEPFS